MALPIAVEAGAQFIRLALSQSEGSPRRARLASKASAPGLGSYFWMAFLQILKGPVGIQSNRRSQQHRRNHQRDHARREPHFRAMRRK